MWSCAVYKIIMLWGDTEIQRLIANPNISTRTKIVQISGISNILKCNDIAYNVSDYFEKALKLMERMNLQPKR